MTAERDTAIAEKACQTPACAPELDLQQVDVHLSILAIALEEAANAIMVADRAGRILWVNRAFTDLTGYSGPEVVGRSTRLLKSGEHGSDVYQHLWSTILGGQVWCGELINRRKNGSLYDEEMTITPVRDASGTIRHFIAIKQDITERKRKEKALRLTQFTVDHAALAVFWVDPDGQVFYANAAAARLLGYSHDELLSMNVSNFDSRLRGTAWRAHWQSLRDAGTLEFEGRSRHKDGTVFPVAITAEYAKFDGREYGFAFVQDISVRKRTEIALAEQKHLFQILMEHVPDHIYFKDRQSRFTRISKAQARHFGLTDPADAIGKTDFDFFSENHARQAYEHEQEIMRTRQPMLGMLELETWPDGRKCWVATSKMPLPDPVGQIVGTFGISRNITKSKSAEEALRASEQFNKRILESSSDGVCVLDLKGSLLYISAGGRKLLELNDSDSIEHLEWLSFWEGSHKQSSQDALLNATAGGIGAYQGSLRTTKGTPKLWDIVISPITAANGAVERLVCVFRDITERRLLESQLSQAQKLESIGQLAAGIAHEINTPIQYIGDNGKFLEEAFQDLMKVIHLPAQGCGDQSPSNCDVDVDYLREEIPKAITQLLEGVEHVARIVRAMKEFSHPGPVERTPVDINRAIESTILVSRNEWKYVADVTTDFDPTLPKVPCIAGEFNQVMLNLIVNAAYAISETVKGRSGAKGAIRISTKRNGAQAEIRVSDTGAGIPEALQSKVFDPFFTTKPVGKGTGQGLAIAHSVVVQKHRGTISFESASGSGTTFLIQLPLGCEIEEP